MDLGRSGLKDQDKQAMREFMQSKGAPETMAKMMAMARQMGNGDVHAGMAKMMDMMGSGGGMMGGRGGMMGPGGTMGGRPGEKPSTK